MGCQARLIIVDYLIYRVILLMSHYCEEIVTFGHVLLTGLVRKNREDLQGETSSQKEKCRGTTPGAWNLRALRFGNYFIPQKTMRYTSRSDVPSCREGFVVKVAANHGMLNDLRMLALVGVLHCCRQRGAGARRLRGVPGRIRPYGGVRAADT